MELVYLWVEDYKNIKKQGFNFSPRFECSFDDGTLTINEKKEDEYIKDFFGEYLSEDLNKRPLSKLVRDISQELGLD